MGANFVPAIKQLCGQYFTQCLGATKVRQLQGKCVTWVCEKVTLFTDWVRRKC